MLVGGPTEPEPTTNDTRIFSPRITARDRAATQRNYRKTQPIAGIPQTERISLTLTEAERAEIEAAVPDDHPVGRWIVEAALMRARGPGID